MGISSLGVGSGILTQDVLDQLRAADDAAQVTPITLNITNENDKKKALEVLDAKMTNLTDSVNELATNTLYDERKVSTTGSSVSITADANSDIQDFTLEVTQLAAKQVEESGSFGAATDKIATQAGTLTLNVGYVDALNPGTDYTISYDETTTLDELKKSINTIAGDKFDATIINIGSNDARLVLSSVDTGSTQNISITDDSGFLSDDGGTTAGGTKLTALSVLQSGKDAKFKFNGGTTEIVRSSNQVDDFITGYNIKLESVGLSEVSVSQNRDEITRRIDSFIEKYNDAMTELDKLTKASTESDVRGIFSGESTIKNMKNSLQSMIGSVGGGVGNLYEYGFDVDKDGKLSIDKDLLNEKLDADPNNFEAFFSGGTYTNADASTTELAGAFSEMSTVVESYTKYNATLDQFNDSITNQISAYESRKESAIERLDAKYEILKKQYTSYNSIINKFNSASDMFVQLANDGN